MCLAQKRDGTYVCLTHYLAIQINGSHKIRKHNEKNIRKENKLVLIHLKCFKNREMRY